MDLSAAITATLDDLYLSIRLEQQVAEPLAQLHHELEFAVPSYLGLRLVLAGPISPSSGPPSAPM